MSGLAPPKSSVSSATTNTDPDARIRLHIAPFSASLLNTYLGPSLLPLATNISFHAPETFPERSFGYVDLPVMVATKLKNKLNGATLKGAKVHIEDAKPEKRKKHKEAAIADAEEEAQPPVKKAKKSMVEDDEQGVIEGIELPQDRKVKRGWTEPMKERRDRKKESKEKGKEEKSKDKKKKLQEKSEYTKEPELLFRTTVPPNVAPIAKASAKEQKKDKKEKKTRRSDREVVVHEFERTKKHASFLRGSNVKSQGKTSFAFDEEKGWVDEDGQVVERRSKRLKTSNLPDLTRTTAPSQKAQKPASPPSKPQEGSGSDEESDEESSVVSSSSEASDSSSSSVSEEAEVDADDDDANGTAKAIIPSAETADSEAAAPTVHPLEALFKRPKLPNGTKKSTKAVPPPIKTAFTFFGNGDDGPDSAEEAERDDQVSELNSKGLTLDIPQTPFTREDMQFRGMRSAAPTPDTAAIGKKVRAPWRTPSDDEDEGKDSESEASNAEGGASSEANDSMDVDENGSEEEAEQGAKLTWAQKHGGKGKDERQMTEFGKKMFWEERAKNNAGWKERRRQALKEKRKRESKKRIGKL